MTTLEKLKTTLEQDVFELILPTGAGEDLRAVYLMNDAVESYFVFPGAVLTGTYQPDFEGETRYDLYTEQDGFILILRQEDCVATLFFKTVELAVHLYRYDHIGHFWVKGKEDLRQLEFKISLMWDKLQYLEADCCNDREKALSVLKYFPPLNQTLCAAIPERYRFPMENPWRVSREALVLMRQIAREAGDAALNRQLARYGWCSRVCPPLGRRLARSVADALEQVQHQNAVKLLQDRVTAAAGAYPPRVFSPALEETRAALCRAAEKAAGDAVQIFWEEPFVADNDGMQLGVYALRKMPKGNKMVVQVEKIAPAEP